MPFWSKKGKERAVEPEAQRSFSGAFLPPTPTEPTFVEPHLPSYKSELWEREADRLMAEHQIVVRETGKCSRQSLVAEEMAMEAFSMYVNEETTRAGDRKDQSQVEAKLIPTDKATREAIEQVVHMHEDCCCTKAAKDERLAWLVRSDRSFRKDRPLWDRPPDESGKDSSTKDVPATKERSQDLEEPDLPSYNEAFISAAFDDRP